MKTQARACTLLLVGAALFISWGCGGGYRHRPGGVGTPPSSKTYLRQDPFEKRPFTPVSQDRWIGTGIAYGPHRDGQFPGGPGPSKDELREDLHLIADHWRMIRLYGSVGPAETILDIIQEDGIDLKVMLGAWIGVEERRDEHGEITERFPETRTANRAEIESAIRLAAAYPGVVLAISAGNETQVFWSAHRSPSPVLIEYLREVRARTEVSVTTADDYNFWNKPESRAIAEEVDFIVTHAHPLWNGLQLENALAWTQETVAAIEAFHPGHTVVLGETGWATAKHSEGEQAKLIQGKVGEEEQKAFFEALNAWVNRARVPTFFFEAFDENWKGGDHPREVEKHWGLFRADRTPKKAISGKP